ncbi:TetR/AcrR family transcriptional regulator [Curtobacterium sp. VKM Ac-1376]|uniref:TetR/AcrR family transcriptional regulator n=1 Tax=Curtobacterium sp. VKM Ac-1376 TaxID=123312 RepID=UPI00188AE310|nr:TetR/AcrR family transcriptional regulator [Curtobacterium sp. VKM Ac-1376]MBF4616006.1 TetR/AcrR family transcriptional regulator [Curtobacterium sp. VKM Ac-1376]
MPKIVDHDQRRAEIVDGFLRIVARDGYEAATTRALADELGVASGAIWHYFRNFDRVVEAAAIRTIDNTTARIERASSGLRGLALFDAVVHEVLPFDKETRDEAAVIVGFWGRAATRPLLTARMGGETVWWDRIRLALDEAVEDGELDPATPTERIVHLLASVTSGQQVAEVLGAGSTTSEEHGAVVDTVLLPWRTRVTSTPSTQR